MMDFIYGRVVENDCSRLEWPWSRGVILHGAVDEPAALARLGDTADNLNSGVLQNHITESRIIQ